MITYGKLEDGLWHPVFEHSPDGCILGGKGFAFSEAWRATDDLSRWGSGPRLQRRWDELACPLPDPDVVCWAYALTYVDHQTEVGLADAIRFRKQGPAVRMASPIPFRENLDFEAEIGVLMHRDEAERFGFLMINDLTDRGIQVREYDRRNPAAGFANAKSFPGALRAGPLIGIGSGRDWLELEIELRLNDTPRQTVRGSQCLLTPTKIHGEIFDGRPASDWALVSTGTPGGCLFRAPTLGEKLTLLCQNGLSIRGARETWLRTLAFLSPGDQLEMRSRALGCCRSSVG